MKIKYQLANRNIFLKRAMFFIIFIASANAFCQNKLKTALFVKLKNVISEKEEYIIPKNNKKSILFFGGKYSKDNKVEWYSKIINENSGIDDVNLIIIIQLANVPDFIPQFLAEMKVKEAMIKLSQKCPSNKNSFFYFDWGEELINYYQTDIDKVSLVVVNSNLDILGSIHDKYTEENIKKLKAILQNNTTIINN